MNAQPCSPLQWRRLFIQGGILVVFISSSALGRVIYVDDEFRGSLLIWAGGRSQDSQLSAGGS